VRGSPGELTHGSAVRSVGNRRCQLTSVVRGVVGQAGEWCCAGGMLVEAADGQFHGRRWPSPTRSPAVEESGRRQLLHGFTAKKEGGLRQCLARRGRWCPATAAVVRGALRAGATGQPPALPWARLGQHSPAWGRTVQTAGVKC
jgi:hypothetical protein